MASPVIKIKRSAVQGNAPTVEQLELGELALNTYDGKLFTEINTGSASIVEIGSNLNTLQVNTITSNVSFTADVTLTGDDYNVVWDKSDNSLEFADNAKAVFGTGSDLSIYHTGNHSFIDDTGTGNLKVRSNNFRISNGDESKLYGAFTPTSVDLYYNNTKRFETTSTGASVTGELTSSGIIHADTGMVVRGDNKSILLGASDDMRIRHTGSHSEITDEGTGDLRLGSNRTIIGNPTFSETCARFVQNGPSELYHDNSLRLKTSSSGVNITDDINVSGITTVAFVDATQLKVSGVTTMTGRLQIDSGDLKIFGTAPTLFLRDTNDNPDYRFMNSHGSIKIFDETNGVDRFIINPHGKVSVLYDLDVDGHTEVDNLKSVGIATFSNNAIHANVYSTGISTISGFRFPSSDGSEDQALVTDGNGTLLFKTLSGGSSVGGATTISSGITTATQGQTVFSTPHPHNDGENTYSTQVFVNGVKQRPQAGGSTKDYTTSSNSTITFEEGLTVGDEVVSVVYFGHTIDEEYFTATEGQVLFPLSGNLAAQKNFRVFINGIKLRNGSDYTVSAPVTFTTPCAEGAEVEIVCDNAEDQFTATDQQTIFTPSSSEISEDNMQVYLNGIQLFEGLDFSIGTPSVTLVDARKAGVGDEVDVCIRRT